MEKMKNLITYVIYNDSYIDFKNHLEGKNIKAKRLSNMLYLAYCYYLVNSNDKYKNVDMDRLFDSRIVATKEGPKVLEVYKTFKYMNNVSSNDAVLEKDSSKTVLDAVLKTYGEFDDERLNRVAKNSAWQDNYLSVSANIEGLFHNENYKLDIEGVIDDLTIYKDCYFDFFLNDSSSLNDNSFDVYDIKVHQYRKSKRL